MTKLTLKLTTLVTAFTLAAVVAVSPAFADDKADALRINDTDVVLGSDTAPITVIEYASMTCGHCAHFETDTFPKIKENYIDTGKIRFVLRDMPWDPLAMAASKVARCAPKDQYYDFASAFFSTQKTWTHAPDPVAELKKIARLGDMDESTFEACLNDTRTHEQVLKSRQVGADVLKVRATPTFFVGPIMTIEGALPYEDVAAQIEKALKLAEKN